MVVVLAGRIVLGADLLPLALVEALEGDVALGVGMDLGEVDAPGPGQGEFEQGDAADHADLVAAVFLGLLADIMDRLGPYLEPDVIDADTVSRLRDGIQLIERKTTRG